MKYKTAKTIETEGNFVHISFAEIYIFQAVYFRIKAVTILHSHQMIKRLKGQRRGRPVTYLKGVFHLISSCLV